MKERTCAACGQSMPDNAKFCDKCGHPAPADVHNHDAEAAEKTVSCPVCGKPSAAGIKYCAGCGSALQSGAADSAVKKCPVCASPLGEGDAFCMKCGTSIGKPDARPAPNSPPGFGSAPPTTGTAAAPAAQGKRTNGRGPLVAVVSVVLVAALLITGFWQPGFFLKGSGANGALHYGNSHAFSVTPFPELTISADENALDYDREFQVAEADEEVFTEVSDTMTENGVLLMNLYELDAGLDDDERFPGVFNMSFDLDELEIPEELHEFTTVYRISDNGEATELACTLENGTLNCQSDKNCLVALGTVLYWGGGVVVAFCGGFFGYKATEEYGQKWEGMTDKILRTVDVCDGRYRVTWAIDDNTEWSVKKANLNTLYLKIAGELNQEIQDAGTWSGYAMAQAYNYLLAEKIAKNQEYQTMLQEFKELTEELGNSTPMQVVQVVQALITADTYLTQTQNMTARTNKTDVILVRDWPSGDSALGYSNNPYAGSPYMRINMSNFPVNGTAADASFMDDVYLTVTHELFHVFQTNYTTIDWNSNLVFWEATAVALETEACSAYLADGTITANPGLTPSGYYETFSTTLGEMPNGGETPAQRNGYTLSNFVRYVQSASGFKLSTLMNAFASTGDFAAALESAAGIDEAGLGSHYLNFCKLQCEQFYKRYKAAAGGSGVTTTLISPVALSSNAVTAEVPVGDMPLAAYFREFKVDTSTIAGGQYALLLASDPGLMTKQNYSTVNIRQGVSVTPKGLFFPVTSAVSSYLFEIHSYVQPDGIDASYTAYLLTPPANPTVTLEEGKTMTVELPPSSTAAYAGMIDGYLVTITSSDGVVTTRHVPYSQWGEPLTLKLKKLTNETEDVSFTVTVKEYIKSGSEYNYGPVSNDGGSYLSEEVLDEELLDAQAGTGEITVSMLWSSADDLDLHVITPSGAEIYYSNKSADGGTLDVDQNAYSDNIVSNPIENIFFQSPQPGTYKVFIVNYTDRSEGGASSYIVRVTVGGQSQTYSGSIDGTGSSVSIVEINYGS